MLHPVKYRLFMLTKLPMGFMAGLKLLQLLPKEAIVGVGYKWLNQNPFRSMYFAVLSMAAELSTGILAFGQVYQRFPQVSMLVVKMEGEFYKKAVGEITFTCSDGEAVINAIEHTILTGEGVTVQCTSKGQNAQGETVAKFVFTWSFKAKSIK